MTATRHYDLITLEDAEHMSTLPEIHEEPRREECCPDFADSEIGAAVRLACDGMDAGEIAELLGEPLTGRQVGALLHLVRGKLIEHGPRDYHRDKVTPKKGRPSGVSDADRQRIYKLRAEGFGPAKIADVLGVSVPQVRWILESRRE